MMFAFGEVQTGLLQNSAALPRRSVEEILALATDGRVRSTGRPIARSVSPHLLEGVDCQLPSASGRQTRGIGTLVSRAVIIGGHVAQASSHAHVAAARVTRRQPWSHYLASPGRLEAIGKLDRADLQRGVMADSTRPDSVEIQAITGRLLDVVQRSNVLDHVPPVLAPRTRLRWTAELGEQAAMSATFTLATEELRTIRLRMPEGDLDAVVALCEDLALHDWLLSTVTSLLDSSFAQCPGLEARITRLRPVVEHLLHLWMPAADVADHLMPVWNALERRPGFTRQWETTAARIRDQIAIGTLALNGGAVTAIPQPAGRPRR
jgi:hypothetical protein